MAKVLCWLIAVVWVIFLVFEFDLTGWAAFFTGLVVVGVGIFVGAVLDGDLD